MKGHAEELIEDYKTSLQKIVTQLIRCGYKDELGHPLFNNVAFIALQELADEQKRERAGI